MDQSNNMVYGETVQTNFNIPPGVRPYTDPNADGMVDVSRYPEPVDSSKKIRGKSELLETLVGGLEPELVVAKGFYFFFYAAFGSLFPLMGVYFKQLGLNGAQAGILSGCRPLVEYIAAPMWVSLAERQGKAKAILLGTLICWILFTFPLGFVQPEPVSCIYKVNASTASLATPEVTANLNKREAPNYFEVDDMDNNFMESPDTNIIDSLVPLITTDTIDIDSISQQQYQPPSQAMLIKTRSKRAIPKPLPGISPLKINYASNYKGKGSEQDGWVSPSFSSQVFKKDDVTKVFFLLLLLIIIGEAVSSPSIVLADTAVLSFLGDQAGHRYGHQRMFGSLGWAIAMFFVGIALDHSTFPDRKCTPLKQEKNYTVCFAIFVVLMGLATLLGWRLKMPEMSIPGIELENQHHPGGFENIDIDSKPKVTSEGLPQTTVFAQTNRQLPEWVIVLRHFKTPNCIAFLFVAWLMGIGIGLIFTFLFWHLQDFGGSPTLFGLASVINHISEVFAYFFSSTFIGQLGHVKVLCIGLLCNVLRFLYITALKNPWWVLPFEFVQGITHAAVWAACSSYLAHNTPPELRQPAQSVLQGLHHGLGRGVGAVVGGLFVSSWGTTATFRLYGLVCLLTLAGFAFLNFYRKDAGGFISEIPEQYDPHMVANEETSHLAPHGVPGSIPRVHSNSRLENYEQQQPPPPQQQQQQPPTMQQQQPGVGGPTDYMNYQSTNPFASTDPSQQQQQQQPSHQNQQYFMR